jgi:hypothetical protein
MSSACDNIIIKVVNNTLAQDGTPIALQIVSAGPTARTSSGGSSNSGGSLSPNGGASLPITVPAGGSQEFTAASGKGSGGWCTGAINISCNFTQSTSNPPSWQALPVVSYSGSPSTIAHNDLCTASCTSSVNSLNFTVVGVAQSGVGNTCVITFTASNGGSSTASA